MTSHKGRFGDLVVVGGDTGMVGAAILAARSGLAAGAGRVFLCALAPESGAFGPLYPDLMQRTARELEHPDALSSRTVVCGCGGR